MELFRKIRSEYEAKKRKNEISELVKPATHIASFYNVQENLNLTQAELELFILCTTHETVKREPFSEKKDETVEHFSSLVNIQVERLKNNGPDIPSLSEDIEDTKFILPLVTEDYKYRIDRLVNFSCGVARITNEPGLSFERKKLWLTNYIEQTSI